MEGIGESRRGIHVAFLREPSLSRVLFGSRTFELRDSRSDHPPYEAIGRGDVVLLKAWGGPISGLARVGRAWMFSGLIEEDWRRLSSAISGRTDFVPDDWTFKRDQRTRLAMIKLANTCTFPVPVEYAIANKGGWSVLKAPRIPIQGKRYVSLADIQAIGQRKARTVRSKLEGGSLS
jgi:hypothetical protein